jgi:hypothetical protein
MHRNVLYIENPVMLQKTEQYNPAKKKLFLVNYPNTSGNK